MTQPTYQEQLAAILKELQVQTLTNYGTAREDGSDLAANLLPDAWSLRLDEAQAAINTLNAEAIQTAEHVYDVNGQTGRARTSMAADLRQRFGIKP